MKEKGIAVWKGGWTCRGKGTWLPGSRYRVCESRVSILLKDKEVPRRINGPYKNAAQEMLKGSRRNLKYLGVWAKVNS